ncbi:MAG: hypothetical protein GIX02_01165, partial [Candidatus Eremiobacteraeota bacterium]|nr:hypothetical protein [Candidatus Eremiobacteraeota bacterium]
VAPPGALAVNPAALTFDNARSGPQSFTATEAIYLGPIFARGCAGVAAVDPPTGSGPTQRFTVTPQTPGSCQITVTDDHGGVQSVSVTIYGTLTVSPTSLSFNTLGSSQDITASEPFYSGNFSAVPMNCGGIATVSGTSPTFTVTSVGPGTCTVVVSDGHGGSVSVSVTVAPQPGPLTLRPNSVTFTDVGAANAATVTVSETNYSGAFTIANDTCSGTIATIGAPSSNGPTATIQITPLSTPSGGSCSFAVRDDHGGSATETVTVGPFGAIVANPSSFTLTVGQTAPLTITESNYSGRFTQSGCTGIARLDGTKPNFTITALAPGTCSFTINDDHGQSTMISVTVTAALTVNPTSLQVATGTSGTFTATDSSCGPSDTISASSANTAVATVTPSTAPCSGGATFTVTGVSTGTTTISVTDTLGGTATVSIGVDVPPAALKKRAVVGKHPITAPTAPRKVLPGTPPSGNAPSRPNPSQRPAAQWTVPGVAALIVGTPNLDFILNGAPQAVPVSEAFYNGMFHAMSSNPQSLAVTAACAGPMCTLIATPSKAGSGTIRVSDDRGTVRLIEFTVAGPRQTTPAQPPAKVSAPGAPKSAAPIPPHAP